MLERLLRVSIWTLYAASSLACTGTASEGPCEPQVKPALDRLLEKQDMDWAFVVVDHPGSESFVQFGLADGGGIFLDMPASALSADERERAAALFAEAGLAGPVEVEATNPADASEVTMALAFQLGFGEQAEEASRFACRMLHEAYRIPEDAPLVVSEGS